MHNKTKLKTNSCLEWNILKLSQANKRAINWQ